MASDAERMRRYRARLRGGPVRTPQPCGTYAAARRHERRGEPLDELCHQAMLAYKREHVRKK